MWSYVIINPVIVIIKKNYNNHIRYASLYFVTIVDKDDNELLGLELI